MYIMDFFWGVTVPIILFLIGLIITILAGIRPLLGDIKEQTKDVPKMFEKLVVLDTRTEAMPSIIEKITTLEALIKQQVGSSHIDPPVRLEKSKIVVDVRAKEASSGFSSIEIFFPIDIPKDAFEIAMRNTPAVLAASFSSRLIGISFATNEPTVVARNIRKFLEYLDSELYKLTHWGELFEDAITKEFKKAR